MRVWIRILNKPKARANRISRIFSNKSVKNWRRTQERRKASSILRWRIGSKAEDAIATAIAQHGDVLMLIGEIVKVGDNNLSRLEEAVETHVKHEENVVFSLAREHLGKDLVDWDRK
jgi:hypothetical protein